MVVFPFEISSNVCWIIFSVAVSKALVASSNNSILGSFKIALAIAILCF